MRLVLALMLSSLALVTAAEERRIEVDPNTKIEGGADPRGSGAGAGATTPPDKNAAERDRRGPEQDQPTSERRAQEREPEPSTIPDRDLRRDKRSLP